MERPSRPRRAKKAAVPGKSTKEKKKKQERKIEYILVPKHWFQDPLNHAMKTAVRPPTKLTRRKELSINLKIPEPVFIELMKPMDDGDMDRASNGRTTRSRS